MADKEFKFNTPDGIQSITLPDDTPPNLAYEKLQEQRQAMVAPDPQSHEAPDLGAFPPETAPRPQNNAKGAAADIGTAGITGAVLGTASPEIMMGMGKGISKLPVPYAKQVGGALTVGGIAARGARLGATADGLLSGLVSESAGQLADMQGLGGPAGLAIRIGAGVFSPNLSTIKGLVGGTAKKLHNVYSALTGGSEAKEKVVQAAVANLKTVPAGTPQHDLHEILSEGAKAEAKAAQEAAAKVRVTAEANAKQVLATNRTAAMKLLEEGDKKAAALEKAAKDRADAMMIASKGKIATATRVKAMADHERAVTLGAEKELSDVGSTLRAEIDNTRNPLLEQRSKAYKEMQAVRDSAVAEKETAGQMITDTPEMQELVASLEKDTAATAKGALAAGGKLAVSSPQSAAALKQIIAALSPKEVVVGTNEAGEPVKRMVKPTFKAIDEVRRQLLDRADGVFGAQGFSALDKIRASDLAQKITKAQESFAGEAQTALQADYAQATRGVEAVTGKTYQKAAAVDKIKMDEYMRDDKTLPGMFFKSKSSVNDLIEMTGKPELVQKEAQSYLSRLFAGHDAKYVEGFLKNPDNSDWIRAVPGLPEKTAQYLDKLKQIERVSAKIEQRAVQTAKGGEEALKLGQNEADAARKAAGTGAATLEKEGAATAKSIVGSADKQAAKVAANVDKQLAKFAEENWKISSVNNYLRTADKASFDTALKYIKGKSGGMEALQGSIRQMSAELAPSSLEKAWNGRLSEMTRSALPPKVYAKLEADVQKVLKAGKPKENLPIVQRLIRDAIVSAGGSAGASMEQRVRNALGGWGTKGSYVEGADLPEE